MKHGFKILDSDMHLREPAGSLGQIYGARVARAGAKNFEFHRPQLGNGIDRGKNSSRLQTDLSWRHLRCDPHR